MKHDHWNHEECQCRTVDPHSDSVRKMKKLIGWTEETIANNDEYMLLFKKENKG